MIRPAPTPSTQAVLRVQAWLQLDGRSRAQIATEAGVDEKIVRLATKGEWNPTISTLEKLEKIIPAHWRPGDPLPKHREAA